MKKLLLSVLAIASILSLNSCGEEFVDNSKIGSINSENFFEDSENAKSAIVGLYDLMQFTYGQDWHSAFLVKLLPGDDANAAGGNSGDQQQLQDIDDYTAVSTANPSIANVWANFYKTIGLANLIVDKVGEGNLSNKEAILAEAKFFRAWSYFELTTMFGDIPLRKSLPAGDADLSIGKSTRAEVYDFIEADLTAAIAGLPDKTAIESDYRVSKGSAQALMGKMLVFAERHQEAIPFFSSVISNPAHDLESDITTIWSQGTDFGKQSLFEIGYVSSKNYDWGGANLEWGGRVESNLHIQLMGPRGDGIFDLGSTGLSNGWGFNLPTAKLVTAFNDTGDTVRKAASLLEESELIAAGGGVNPPADGVWDYEGAIRVKFAPRPEDTAGGVGELNYTTNWRLFRYAEVLLLAAEAYNKAGQDGPARTELNKVRVRAGLAPDNTSSGTALFDVIVNEKFLELSQEGQRFWDLVRWGMAPTELAGTGYSMKNDLFPIPVNEINLNEGLSPADQNPGY